MKYKSSAIRAQFIGSLRTKGQAVAYAMDGYMRHNFGVELFITSIIRENSQQHELGFAFDIRTTSLTWEQGDELLAFINRAFDYASDRVVVVDEREPGSSPNWSAPHFHGQINYRNGTKWI